MRARRSRQCLHHSGQGTLAVFVAFPYRFPTAFLYCFLAVFPSRFPPAFPVKMSYLLTRTIPFSTESPFHGPAGHIDSRDGLQEARRPDTDLPHTALRALTARLVPGPTLSCNSSGTAIAIPQASRAHQLARWHRFVSIEHREPL